MKLAMAGCCTTRRPGVGVYPKPPWLEEAEAKYHAWQLEHEDDPLQHEALFDLLKQSPDARKQALARSKARAAPHMPSL